MTNRLNDIVDGEERQFDKRNMRRKGRQKNYTHLKH